jgi:hypothetical protein
MTITLEPCPFCGKEMGIVKNKFATYAVHPRNKFFTGGVDGTYKCIIETEKFQLIQPWIDLWNSRTADKQQKEIPND